MNPRLFTRDQLSAHLALCGWSPIQATTPGTHTVAIARTDTNDRRCVMIYEDSSKPLLHETYGERWAPIAWEDLHAQVPYKKLMRALDRLLEKGWL